MSDAEMFKDLIVAVIIGVTIVVCVSNMSSCEIDGHNASVMEVRARHADKINADCEGEAR